MRGGQPRAVRRVLFAVVVTAGAAIPLAALSAAEAVAADPLAEAKQRADEARRQADDAAGRYTNAQSSFEDLGNKIADNEQKIAAGEARRQELRGIAARRAIVAYKTQGSDRAAILDAQNPSEGMRSAALLDRANEADHAAVADPAAPNAELAAQRDQLDGQHRDFNSWHARLADEKKLLDGKAADADRTLRDLQAKAAAEGRGLYAPRIDGRVCPVPRGAVSRDFAQPRT